MNFLQLVQRLKLECGVSGSTLTTVSNQSNNQFERLIAWTNAAWIDIQEAHPNWDWMRTPITFATTATQSTYTLGDIGIDTTFGVWKEDSFRNYVTSVGYGSEVFMAALSYDQWRNQYEWGNLRTTYTRPVFMAVAPDKSLCLGPVPDSTGYTVVGEYYRKPTELVDDADTPDIPSKFHLAIVYRSMMHYGMYEAAPEVVQRATLEFNRMLRRMEADQLPQVNYSGALV